MRIENRRFPLWPFAPAGPSGPGWPCSAWDRSSAPSLSTSVLCVCVCFCSELRFRFWHYITKAHRESATHTPPARLAPDPNLSAALDLAWRVSLVVYRHLHAHCSDRHARLISQGTGAMRGACGRLAPCLALLALAGAPHAGTLLAVRRQASAHGIWCCAQAWPAPT